MTANALSPHTICPDSDWRQHLALSSLTSFSRYTLLSISLLLPSPLSLSFFFSLSLSLSQYFFTFSPSLSSFFFHSPFTFIFSLPLSHNMYTLSLFCIHPFPFIFRFYLFQNSFILSTYSHILLLSLFPPRRLQTFPRNELFIEKSLKWLNK